ncbi:MAG: type II TA system antitoxin MqsA family protein, partial [Bacteroidota bacterium]
MKSPFTGGKVRAEHAWETYEFRKESFEIWKRYYVCEDTGESFTTPEDDELDVRQAHNLYRVKHNIPFPEEIKAIRKTYGLSAAKMSEVLDLGINTYRQYEAGEIPSLANAKIIRLAKDPRYFRNFLEEKEALFSAKAYQRAMDNVQAMLKDNPIDAVVEYLWNFHMEPNEYTGFVKPSLEKVAHFVLFFAQKAKPLKTRMNKLLFYADFLNFKRNGSSISGCNYRAIPYGPVPSHFHELFGLLQNQDFIRIEEEEYEHGGIGERFYS